MAAFGIGLVDVDEVQKSRDDQAKWLAKLQTRGLANISGPTTFGSSIYNESPDLSRFTAGLRTPPAEKSNVNLSSPEPIDPYSRPHGPAGLLPHSDTGASLADSNEGFLQLPDFDNSKELPSFSRTEEEKAAIAELYKIDPNASEFVKDIQGLWYGNEFDKALIKLSGKSKRGYGSATASNLVMNIYGYFFDRPDAAQSRKDSSEAAKWYISKDARAYFSQNPEEIGEAALDPVIWYKKFKADAPVRDSKLSFEESTNRTDKLITNVLNAAPNGLRSEAAAEVRALASHIGVNENLALAILGVESAWGANPKTSSAGAKSALQVTVKAYDQIKEWFPNNKTASNIPDHIIQLVNSLPADYNKASPSDLVAAGVLYMKYGQYLGVPDNLIGAGYQGGMEGTAKRQSPSGADDTNIYNSDYNRAVIEIYNKLSGAPTQTAGVSTGSVSSDSSTEDVSVDTSAQASNTGDIDAASQDVSSLATVTAGEEQPVLGAGSTSVSPTTTTAGLFLEGTPQANEDINLAVGQYDRVKIQSERDLALLWKIAQIHAASGDLGKYQETIATIQTKRNNAEETLAAYDQGINTLWGNQALSDLSDGSTATAAWYLSKKLNRNYMIYPRTDGLYDIEIDNKPYTTIDFNSLSHEIRSSFDSNYLAAIQAQTTEFAKLDKEAQLEIIKKQWEQKGDMLKAKLDAALGKGKGSVVTNSDGFTYFQHEDGTASTMMEVKTEGPSGEEIISYQIVELDQMGKNNNYGVGLDDGSGS